MRKLFNDFRRWLATLLMPDEQGSLASITLPENLPPEPAPNTALLERAGEASTPMAAQPGLNCPECSTKIAITIPMLLSGQPFYCMGCFLEISVNQTESAAALNALQKLQGEFQKAEAIVKSSKS
jgi:hypothetical protein